MFEEMKWQKWLIVRLICLARPAGFQPTLTLLDSSAVLLKCLHILIIAGNAGTFQRSVRQICTDTEMVYLMFCYLGLVTHSAFFSVLVR